MNQGISKIYPNLTTDGSQKKGPLVGAFFTLYFVDHIESESAIENVIVNRRHPLQPPAG